MKTKIQNLFTRAAFALALPLTRNFQPSTFAQGTAFKGLLTQHVTLEARNPR